jgi:hypothetical protein
MQPIPAAFHLAPCKTTEQAVPDRLANADEIALRALLTPIFRRAIGTQGALAARCLFCASLAVVRSSVFPSPSSLIPRP